MIQGLLVLAVLATVFIGAARMRLPEPDLRALVFASLVLANMGLILINRSFTASLISAFMRPNRSLWILLGSVSAVLTAAMYWPPARSLFRFGELHWDDLAVCGAAGLAILLLLEALKARWFRVAAV